MLEIPRGFVQSILLRLWLGIIWSLLSPSFRNLSVLSTRNIVDLSARYNSANDANKHCGEVSQDVGSNCWWCRHFSDRILIFKIRLGEWVSCMLLRIGNLS